MCRDTDFCVVTMALQCETGVCRERVPFYRNNVTSVEAEVCHDITFFVATGFGLLVSRHSLDVMTRLGLWAMSQQACIQRAATERPTHSDKARCVRTIERTVLALCTRQTCDSVLCCVLFRSLYMDTVHEHCSWALFKKKKNKEKKYKNDPRGCGRHR